MNKGIKDLLGRLGRGKPDQVEPDLRFMSLNPRYQCHEIGEWSYGQPEVLSWNEGAKLQIGRYCSIAEGVTIMLGGEHRMDWVTTFPFSQFFDSAAHIKGHPRTKGDVSIGHDVWICRDALILSGVTIGTGSVIGARAVVTKDVPPYGIVAGNPARMVGSRFSPDVIAALLRIAWWNWSRPELEAAMPFLLSPDIQAFVKKFDSRAGS